MSDSAIVKKLAADLAETKRRLRKLETAPRGPFTSVQGGAIRWLTLDEPPMERVAIGIESDTDEAFVRIWNEDGTAKVFEAAQGRSGFPLPVCAWMRDATQTGFDAAGWPSVTGATFVTTWVAALSLTTEQIRAHFVLVVAGGSTAEVRFRAVADSFVTPRVGFASNGLQVLGAFSGLTGTVNLEELLTVPTTLWTPSADPVGTHVILTCEARVTAGAGAVAVKSAHPVYCRL